MIKIATKAEDVTTANLPCSSSHGDLSHTEVSGDLFSKLEVSDVAQGSSEKQSLMNVVSSSDPNTACHNVHSGDSELQVSVVSSSNATTDILKPKSHRTFERYSCANCEEVCMDRASYISHVRACISNDGKPKECKLCGRVLVSQRNLRNHINLHCDNEKFACKQCGLKYTWKASLTLHLKSGSCRDPATETSLRKAVVVKAMSESGETQGLETEAQQGVNVVGKGVHTNEKQEEPAAESFEASSASSGQISKLRYHSTRASGHSLSVKSERHDDVEETIDMCNDPSDTFIYPCIDCGKPFKFEDSMWRHYETSHCVMSFGSRHRASGSSHQASGRSHPASVRGRQASGSSHQTCGSSQKQVTTSSRRSDAHKCTICGKTYTRPSILMEHMALHTGKRLQCHNCGMKFVWSSNLRKHRRRGECVGQSLETRSGEVQGVATAAADKSFTGKRRKQVAKKTFPRSNNQVKGKLRGSDARAITKAGSTEKLSSNQSDFSQERSLLDKKSRQQMNAERSKEGHFSDDAGTKDDESSDKIMSSDAMTQSSEIPGAAKKRLKHPTTCNKCGKKFPTLLAKTRHMVTHAGDKMKCHLCQAKFTWRSSLRKHLKWNKCQTKVKVVVKENKKVEKKKPNDYPLKIQDIVSTIENIEEKRPTVIVSTFIRNAITVVEGFGVSEEMAELREVGSGPDVGLYRCEVCNNEYTYRSSLKIHMRNHTGEMPYKCNICKKHFRCRRYCRKHVISHGKESSSQEIRAAFEQVLNEEETSAKKVAVVPDNEAEKDDSEATDPNPKQLVTVGKSKQKVGAKIDAKKLEHDLGTVVSNRLETRTVRKTNDIDKKKSAKEGSRNESNHTRLSESAASGSCSDYALTSPKTATRQHNNFPQKDLPTTGSRKRRQMDQNKLVSDSRRMEKAAGSDSDSDIRGKTTKRQRLRPRYAYNSRDIFEEDSEISEKQSSHDEWCEERSPEQCISDDELESGPSTGDVYLTISECQESGCSKTQSMSLPDTGYIYPTAAEKRSVEVSAPADMPSLRYIGSTVAGTRAFTTLTAQLHGISDNGGDKYGLGEQLSYVKQEVFDEWDTPNESYAMQGGDAAMLPQGEWSARIDGLTENGVTEDDGVGIWVNQGDINQSRGTLVERNLKRRLDGDETGTWVKQNESAANREGSGSQDTNNGSVQEEKEEYLFQCQVCNAKFTSKFVLRRHEVITGHAKVSYECPYCKRIYSEGGAYANHMFVHQRENGMKCDICGKELQSRTTFMNHMAMHKKNPITCNLCYELFQNEEMLREHVETAHDSLKEFKCKYCKKTFDWQSNYSRHLNKHTNKKEFKCKICNYSFNIISNLKRHVLKIHNGQAEGDEASWEAVNPVQQDLVLNRQHQRRDLWQANEDADIESEVVHRRRGRLKALQSPNRKKYRCNICQFLCSSRMHLTNHLRYGHKKENSPATALLHFIIEDENFVCQLCGSVIYSRHSLKNHFLKVHKMGLDEDNIAGITRDGKQLDEGMSYADDAALSESTDSRSEIKGGKSHEYDVQILDSRDRDKRTLESKLEISDSDTNSESLPFVDVEKLSREANNALGNVGHYSQASDLPAVQERKDSARPMKRAASKPDSKPNCIELDSKEETLLCSLCRVLFQSRDLLVRHLHHFHKIPEGFEEALIDLTRDVVKIEPGESASQVGVPPKKSNVIQSGTSTMSSSTAASKPARKVIPTLKCPICDQRFESISALQRHASICDSYMTL